MSGNLSTKVIVWGLMISFLLTIIWATFTSISKLNASSGVYITLNVEANTDTYKHSGSYLVYAIDYRTDIQCPKPRPAIMCIRTDMGQYFGDLLPSNTKPSLKECHAFIRGTCKGDQFRAKIEYLKVAPNQLPALKQGLQRSLSQIKIRVDSEGLASVVELYINNTPWSEYLKSPH